ncbi:MAG: hypothetical protein R3B13_16485 [Polyangiaceae bacterium]
MNLDEALEAFVSASADARAKDARLSELLPQVLRLSKGQPKVVVDRVLRRLLDATNAPHPQAAGLVALLSGCVVEEGADPELAVKVLVPRLEAALTAARSVVDAATNLDEVETENEQAETVEVANRLVFAREWDAIVDSDSLGAQSLLAIDHFCQPLIAALSRKPDLLKSSSVQALLAPLTHFSDASMYSHFLARLLRVPIDEEWFILDPQGCRGFALQVTGVANAFQVYALLHAVLCGVPRSITHWSRPVRGPQPPSMVLAVADGSGPQEAPGSYVPPFTLFRWSAMDHPGKIPGFDDHREWYSNSAGPAELARFGEARIGILGDVGFRMEFGLAREFAALRASVTLMRQLDRRHVVELFHAFGREVHPGHPIPGVGWP